MTTDGDRARELYRFLTRGAPDRDALFAVIPWATPVKRRARTGNGVVYSDPEQAAAELATGMELRRWLPGGRPLTGNLAVGCIFYRPTRRVVDGDNLLKHVLDAANGAVFRDDSQVTRLFADVELDRMNPRTVVVIGRHTSTLTREAPAPRRPRRAPLPA